MALPVLPIALGLGALLGGYLLLKPSGPSAPGLPGAGPMDDNRRAQIRAEVQKLLAEGKDPAKMEQVATAIEPYGFQAEATALRARAAQLRLLGSGPAAPPAQPAVYPVPMPDSPLPPMPSIPVPPSAVIPGVTATVTGTDVNVRSGPSTSSAVLGVVSRPATVAVTNWNAGPPDSAAPQGWAAVMTPSGVAGYMAKQYLQQGGGLPAIPASAPSGPAMATYTGSDVALRSAPSTSSTVLTRPPKGATVLVLNWNGAPPDGAAPLGWAQVQYGSFTGYSSKQYLALAGGPSTAGYRVMVGARRSLWRRG